MERAQQVESKISHNHRLATAAEEPAPADVLKDSGSTAHCRRTTGQNLPVLRTAPQAVRYAAAAGRSFARLALIARSR
jgi:hypothetical protein